MSARHDMRKAIRACERAGLTYDAAHKHPRIVHPATGRFVVVSGSPSCTHAAKNMLTDVRKKLGVAIEL